MAADAGGIAGANIGGTNVAVPSSGTSSSPPIGSSQGNPMVPSVPTGQQGLPQNSLGNSNVAGMLGFGANGFPNQNDFIKAMHKAGFSAGIAGELWNFLQSGAGFNPQIADALINSMKPKEDQARAQMMEQFGTLGMPMSSSAAYGMSQLESGFDLNHEQVFAQMMEQATNNYLSVLMGSKGQPPAGLFQNLMSFMQTSAGVAKAAAAFGADSKGPTTTASDSGAGGGAQTQAPTMSSAGSVWNDATMGTGIWG